MSRPSKSLRTRWKELRLICRLSWLRRKRESENSSKDSIAVAVPWTSWLKSLLSLTIKVIPSNFRTCRTMLTLRVQRIHFGSDMTRATIALASLMREITMVIEQNASNLAKMNKRWTRVKRLTREKGVHPHPQSRLDLPWQDNTLAKPLERTLESTIMFKRISRTCRELPMECVIRMERNQSCKRQLLHLAKINRVKDKRVWQAPGLSHMVGTDHLTTTTFSVKLDLQR